MKKFLALALCSIAGAAQAQPIVMGCVGTLQEAGGAKEHVSLGVVIDMDKKTIVVGDTPYTIYEQSETGISFSKETGFPDQPELFGSLDRITGYLTTTWVLNETGTFMCSPSKPLF